MAEPVEILPVRGIGEVMPGADLAAMIMQAAPWLLDGDILVVTSKIVSKAEGQVVDVPAGGPERDAARDEILTAQTARTVARRGHTRIVQTHHGFVMASAGVDASNVDRNRLVLLPKDPDASARSLRVALSERFGLDLAVIISDTMGRPWRNGLTDVALGAAGIAAILDHRGELDPYGNQLHITQMAIADELAAAADLVKGKREQVPVAVIRGYRAQPDDDATEGGAVVLIRDAESDLFSLGTAEARAEGLRAAATLADSPGFAAEGELIDAAIIHRALEGVATPMTVERVGDSAPPGTAHVIRLLAAERPADAVRQGADLHRVRCALAAEGLATIWLAEPGLLAVGRS